MPTIFPGIKSFDKDRYMLSVTEIVPGQYEKFINKINYQQPHRRNYFVFFLVTSGYIQHSIDFQSVRTAAKSIFFTEPDQVYFVEHARNIGGLGISFADEILTSKEIDLPIIQNLYHINECALNKTEFATTIGTLKNMLDEYSKKTFLSDMMLHSYLTSLLIQLSRNYLKITGTKPGQDVTDSSVLKFKSLVSKNWNKYFLVADYAKMMNVSPGHLNYLIKKHTGKKAIDWILSKKLIEAKRLLLHTEKSAKEIAFELGFDDPGYFNRFFKKYTQSSPLIFRKEIREKYNPFT